MTIKGYTPEELSVLTPDERSALEAEEGGDEEALQELASGDDGQGGESGEGNGDDGQGQGGEGAGNDGGESADAEAQGGDQAATTGKTSEQLLDDDEPFVFEAPADAAEKRKTLTAERDEAFGKLMEGTIDTEAYNAINNRVTSELEAIASAVSKAELATAMREHEVKKAWKKTVNEFFEDAKKEGADYRANEELNKELDGLVKIFAAEAQAKGITDVGLKASKYALEQAQIVMRARHGFKVPDKEAPAGKTAAEKAIEAANSVRHGLKTLTNIPAADRVLTDDSPLAKVATLEGEELELYMATLTPAQMRALEAAGDR